MFPRWSGAESQGATLYERINKDAVCQPIFRTVRDLQLMQVHQQFVPVLTTSFRIVHSCILFIIFYSLVTTDKGRWFDIARLYKKRYACDDANFGTTLTTEKQGPKKDSSQVEKTWTETDIVQCASCQELSILSVYIFAVGWYP
jgi:hypothetical protein